MERPTKRCRLEATENEVEAGGQTTSDKIINEDNNRHDKNVCKYCQKKFANPHNRERHEKNIHEGHGPETSKPSTQEVFSP